MDTSGSSQLVCMEAPFLEGALHREHDHDYGESGQRRVRELIFGSRNRVFTLSQPPALASVAPDIRPRCLLKFALAVLPQ